MKVSIGIPFFNPGNVFRESIQSILNQTYSDFELILLDDGSTDNSLEIAHSFKDKRIKVISDGGNKGLPYRLNQLVDISQGEYIARMDADDLSSSVRIELQTSLLENTPDVDIIATGLCSITDKNKIIGYRLPSIDKRMTPSVTDAIFGRSEIAHATILVRKSWYLRNRYNEKAKLMEDYQLWVDAAIKSDLNIAYIKKPLYFYREESSVNYRKAVKAYFNCYKIVFNQYFNYLSLHDKIRITLLTIIKITVVSAANLFNLSDKLLYMRNKGTEQDNTLIDKLEEEVKKIRKNT